MNVDNSSFERAEGSSNIWEQP